MQNSLDPYDTTNNHPVYASHPIYIEEHANNIEKLLVKYLEVYKNILKYVEENKSQLDWSRLFIMVYLDCLIYWSKEDTELSYNFILNGPFHPLILAKRYMVQFALVERAKRLTCNDTVFYVLSGFGFGSGYPPVECFTALSALCSLTPTFEVPVVGGS